MNNCIIFILGFSQDNNNEKEKEKDSNKDFRNIKFPKSFFIVAIVGGTLLTLALASSTASVKIYFLFLKLILFFNYSLLK